MRTKLLVFAVALLALAATASTVAAQPPPIRGPGEPIGPPGPVDPPVPRGPQIPERPGRSSGDLVIYTGTSNDIVARIERGSGGTLYVNGGQMTKRGARVYDGRRLTLNAVIYTVLGGSVIPGVSTNLNNAACTLRGNRVFDNRGTHIGDVLYTFKSLGAEHRLYQGASTGSLSDVVFTMEGRLTSDNKPLVAIIAGC